MSKENITEQTTAEWLETTKNEITRYVDLKTDLIKADVIEKISVVIGKMATFILLIGLVVFVLLFSSIAIGLHLSTIYNSYVIGFGVVAFVYLFLFILLVLFKKIWIESPVANSIIKLFYHE